MTLTPAVANDPSILKRLSFSLFAYRTADLADRATFKTGGLNGYAIITDVSIPQGDLEPIRFPDPARYGQFVIADVIQSAPDLPEVTITEVGKNDVLLFLEQMAQAKCGYDLILKVGQCGRPDTLADWKSLYIMYLSRMTEYNPGELQAFDEDARVESEGTVSPLGIYRVFPIALGEVADSVVLAEVVDVTYGDTPSCGDCEPYSDGCQRKFALTKYNSGSPGLSGQVAFTIDGVNYDKDDINGLGTNSPDAFAVMGNYLVVVSEAAASHFYALISDVTTNPNGQNWTAVATGYVGGNGGNDIFAQTPQLAWIAGDGGYLYKLTDPTSGVEVVHAATLTTQNLNRVFAVGQNVIAVGDSNAMIVSTNGGESFFSVTGPSVGDNLLAVWAWNANQWMVGNNQGELWYTVDGGDNWTQIMLPNQANLSEINDIGFDYAAPTMGALAVQTASAGYIYRTFDRGRTWSNSTPAIRQVTTAPEKYNAVSLCGENRIFAGGKEAASSDGYLAEAS